MQADARRREDLWPSVRFMGDAQLILIRQKKITAEARRRREELTKTPLIRIPETRFQASSQAKSLILCVSVSLR